MELKQKLTKGNFFNGMMEKYPKAMKVFCDWIDEYKKAANWNKLFNSTENYQDSSAVVSFAPKFHDIPHAMQTGIWLEFAIEKGYPYLASDDLRDYDLKQDIEITLQQIETGIPLPHPSRQ